MNYQSMAFEDKLKEVYTENDSWDERRIQVKIIAKHFDVSLQAITSALVARGIYTGQKHKPKPYERTKQDISDSILEILKLTEIADDTLIKVSKRLLTQIEEKLNDE